MIVSETFRKRPQLYTALILFFVVLTIYVFFAGRLMFDFPNGSFNYFSHQAFSFLHGKIDLYSTDNTTDLTVINGKKYMYWGPPPTILVFPFIIIFGLGVSDAFYTAIISSLAPLILFFIFKKLEKLAIVKINDFLKVLLCIFFAFGTPYFSLAVNGSVWYTSQAINTIYILASFYFLLNFVDCFSKFDLVLSSILLGLAVWGRNSLIFYIPLSFFLISLATKRKTLKSKIKYYLVLAIPLLLIFSFYLSFNYLRFGKILETGYTFHGIHPHFYFDKVNIGVINIRYLPRNFYYMFLSFPRIISKFPFFKFDPEGNSIIFTSPLFLLILLKLKDYIKNYKRYLFQLAILMTIILTTSSLLVFYGTGWVQFGYRYTMDAFPLILILIADSIKKIPAKLAIMVVSYSFLVNVLGILWLFNS